MGQWVASLSNVSVRRAGEMICKGKLLCGGELGTGVVDGGLEWRNGHRSKPWLPAPGVAVAFHIS